NRQESEEKVNVECYGIDPEPFDCRVSHPDVPGEYCFPPLASLITGGARLMLALLEHCVSELGGTYAMEDTDSMAIVATQYGGLVLCPGGPHKLGKKQAVKALSWKQVEAIADRFASLNPYDPLIVNGSVLKIEDDNFDPHTGKQRPVYCLAISAKRYALFLLDKKGIPTLLTKDINNKSDRWSEHGLGHLLNPVDPTSDDRDWIAHAWLNIVRQSLGQPTVPLTFKNMPAVGRVSVGSPAVMKPMQHVNLRKTYSQQIKPFNFLLTTHVKQLGHPIGADPEHFHLVAPYESDSRRWLKTEWIDQYTGNTFRIATLNRHDLKRTALVKTYGDVLLEYEFHQESKCADCKGAPCGKTTQGLLQRRHVLVDHIKYIGKESNSLEDVNSGMINSASDVYTEYHDKSRDEWQVRVLPRLRTMQLSVLVRQSGLSRRMLIDARAGRSRPHRKNQRLLKLIVHQ
ncbi:MAG TPA: hypothetical protein VM260_09990, partial [Pirellula sp.]|nr:hypothetical protein [Pirellula sp.]